MTSANRLRVRELGRAISCAWCRDQVELAAQGRVCTCGVALHAECAVELEAEGPARCPTPGCGSLSLFGPDRPQPPRREEIRALSLSWLTWLGVVCAFLSLGAWLSFLAARSDSAHPSGGALAGWLTLGAVVSIGTDIAIATWQDRRV